MKKPVILCVDDEEIVVHSLREQIKGMFSAGFDVEVAMDGIEALNLFDDLIAEEIEVPLVISDYIMPRMNGDEFLRRVFERSPKTMNILLTGQATLEGVVNSVNYAGLYRYIAKPWEKEDLRMAIAAAVKSYDMDRKIEDQNEQLERQNEALRRLYEEEKRFTEAFVETMVTALDRRDTTTAGHSKRLAGLALRLAQAVNRSTNSAFSGVRFTDDELQKIHYAALLHDVGKIGVSEKVLLKQHRLSDEHQRALNYKFRYLKLVLEKKDREGTISPRERDLLGRLDDDLAFVMKLCTAQRLDEPGERRLRALGAESVTLADGTVEHLLDPFEMENLLIRRGNLTAGERAAIESHVSITYELLRSIPWPKPMVGIAELAASHHEKLDGSGYCLQQKGDELSIQTRILAMLDMYEALTSADRPYKKALEPEEALQLLRGEVARGTLDPDLFDLFVQEQFHRLSD